MTIGSANINGLQRQGYHCPRLQIHRAFIQLGTSVIIININTGSLAHYVAAQQPAG
jgi:hypothetical protein